MTTNLSKKQLERYDRDGIIFPLRVMSGEKASFFRDELESLARSCSDNPRKRFDSLHLFFDWAYRLATHKSILDIVENILGHDLLIDGTLVFYKPANDASYASWHQDSFYSGWHLTPSISAWIALTPSHRDNGCMRVIPGSQKQGLLNHINIQDPNLLNRRGEQIEVDVDESQAVDVVLKPGEMSLHHSNIVHGSNPNTSDEQRIGFIVRFVTNRIARRDRSLLRVRGDADCTHLTLAEAPLGIDHDQALASWLNFETERS